MVSACSTPIRAGRGSTAGASTGEGAISERTRIAEPEVAVGRPDGGSCDVEGYYWSAGVSAGHVNRFTADGSWSPATMLPVPAPTMPCFGGPDFRTLYLTSLREGRSAALLQRAPQSGARVRGRGADRRVPVMAVP